MDKAQAELFCFEYIQKINSSINEDGSRRITLDAAFSRYFNEKAQYQTRPQQTLTRLQNLKRDLNVKFLDEITEPVLTNLVSNYRKELKNSTINRYIALLSVIINTADFEWKVSVPHIKVSRFKLREPAGNIKFLKDWETAQKIIDRAAPHLKPIIYTALYTGLRLGNILNLKWGEVDLKNKVLIVHTKDSTQEGGKNEIKHIVAPLCDILAGLPRVSEYVFTYKGEPIKSIQTAWKNIFYKRGKNKQFTKELKDPEIPYINFHVLRHTHATWFLRQTKNVFMVQKEMGHKSLNTTKRYAHIVDDEVCDALDSLFK